MFLFSFFSQLVFKLFELPSHRKELFEDKLDFKVLKSKKWEYYAGKSSPEEYMENPPSGTKILKGDIEKYIEMDKDVKNLAEKLSAQEVVVEYLQNTLNTMRDRSYSVQAAIKMRIFLSGG